MRRRIVLMAVFGVAPLVCGCVSYGRIQPVQPIGPSVSARNAGKLRVMECHVEVSAPLDGRLQTYVAKDLATAFHSARPEWCAPEGDPDSIPIIVKLRSEEDFLHSGNAALSFVSGLAHVSSLGIFPWMVDAPVSLGVSIQLKPGAWSDAKHREATAKTRTFNFVSAAVCSSAFPPAGGWVKGSGNPYGEPDGKPLGEHFGISKIYTPNPGFIAMLADLVVEAWNRLSPDERFMAIRNPVAWKLAGVDEPALPAAVPTGTVPVAVRPEQAVVVVNKGFDSFSGRGFVRFRRGGAEPVAAQRYIRRKVLPELVGTGEGIRIVAMTTEDDGTNLIEFFVPNGSVDGNAPKPETPPSEPSATRPENTAPGLQGSGSARVATKPFPIANHPRVVTQSWSAEARRGAVVLDLSGCVDREAALAWATDEYIPDWCRTLGVAVSADNPGAAPEAVIRRLPQDALPDGSIRLEFSVP